MHRALLVVLVLTAIAAAQGVDEWIDTALDPRTPPEQRVDALKKVALAKEGPDKLAEKGLAPARDPEVIHAVVDTLLKTNDYRPYIERMVRLLLHDKHRDKVLRRFQGVWEADRGQPLLDACVALARDPDPQLREASVVALGKIPRRKAAEAIVDAGLVATEEPVRAAARVYVQRWFGVTTLREAADLLRERRLDTFYDLVEARIEALSRERGEHERTYARFLAKASAAEALDELERGGAYRLFAAQRLAKLAEENGIKDRAEFARRILDAIVAERAREASDARVLAPLLAALQRDAGDPQSPLWQVRTPKDVREAIEKLADVQGTGPELQQLGSLAVRLLGAIDVEGLSLYEFAQRFPSVEVRKEAIQQLGQLASRLKERSNYVAIRLTGILSAEKEPAIRAQILNLLTQPHVPVVSEPVDVVKVVRGYLEKGATPELTDAELRDAAIILGKRRTPDAKEALLSIAASHERLQVRRFVLEEALVPWARADESIHDSLVQLALSPDQQPEARKAVVEALGRRGGRRSEATLRTIEESDRLDDALRLAVKDSKLQLLERLANGKGAAADAPDQKAADLEAALRILEQEVATADPERMEPLALLLVKQADAAGLPAGTARYRLAWLGARLPPGKLKAEDVIRRYEDALANVVADRLPPSLHEALLTDYRELLLRGPAEGTKLGKAVAFAEKLAELALEEKDKGKAARWYLEAADGALRLANGPLARQLLDKAATTGGVGGELVARERELRGRVEQLPKSG